MHIFGARQFKKNKKIKNASDFKCRKKNRAVSNCCHSILYRPIDYFMDVYGKNTSVEANASACVPLTTIFVFWETTLPQHIFLMFP